METSKEKKLNRTRFCNNFFFEERPRKVARKSGESFVNITESGVVPNKTDENVSREKSKKWNNGDEYTAKRQAKKSENSSFFLCPLRRVDPTKMVVVVGDLGSARTASDSKGAIGKRVEDIGQGKHVLQNSVRGFGSANLSDDRPNFFPHIVDHI